MQQQSDSVGDVQQHNANLPFPQPANRTTTQLTLTLPHTSDVPPPSFTSSVSQQPSALPHTFVPPALSSSLRARAQRSILRLHFLVFLHAHSATFVTLTATLDMTAIPSPRPLPNKPPPASAPTSTSPSPSHSHHSSLLASPTSPPSLPDIFQDLESRFLLNLPDSELSSFTRLFFQLQQAHWFYCDFYVDRWPGLLPPYNQLKTFCSKFFSLSPLLSSQLSRFEGLYDSFTAYLHSVPVCGVILLNERLDRVLMVRGWKGNTWSFPKGKIDANESELQCAVRECREEVGYVVREGEAREDDWIEAAVSGKSVKLFILSGVDEQYQFETQTRKEISGIEWVDINSLPSYRDNRAGVGGGSGSGGEVEDKKRKFWSVMPFVDELRRWINNKKKGKANQRRNKQQQQQQQQQPKAIKPTPSHPIPIHHAATLSATPPPLSSSVPTASPHPFRPPPSTARHSIDDSNAVTFAGGGVAGGGGRSGTGGSGGGGWSAEEMFALNEAKYGVRSSVVEEKLEEPENIDEIMRSVMGPRYRGGGGRGSSRGGDRERGGAKHRSARSEQLYQSALSPSTSPTPLPPLPEQPTQSTSTAAVSQPPARGRGFRGRGRGNARNTLPIPGTTTTTNTTTASTTSPALNVEELDFSHNPYQPRTLAVSTTPTNPTTTPLHSLATHSAPSSVLPSPASFSQLSAKSAATPTTQPLNTNGSGSMPPYSARASDQLGGGKTGQTTFSEFRFDLDSILQPLSATKLD